MAGSYARIGSLFYTAANFAKEAMVPGVTATVAYLSDSFIQAARNHSDATKNEEKDNYSTLSSTVNTLAIGYTLSDYLLICTRPEVWKNLTTAQRLTVAFTAVAAVGGAGYSLSRFGIENNTLWAGIAAASSSLLFNVAKDAATLISHKKRSTEDSTIQTVTEETSLIIADNRIKLMPKF